MMFSAPCKQYKYYGFPLRKELASPSEYILADAHATEPGVKNNWIGEYNKIEEKQGWNVMKSNDYTCKRYKSAEFMLHLNTL